MKRVLFAALAMNIIYAGFDFGECSGSGTFEQHINQYGGQYENATYVGTIPKGIKGLKINLLSDKDVDIRLYGKSNRKIVHWPKGLLRHGFEETKNYKGVAVTYSGYNGVNGELGHEFINIEKSTPEKLTMKAFGFREGNAVVNYSWSGKDGCEVSDSGDGTFKQAIKRNSSTLVGTIPPNVKNLEVYLESDKDIDIQLFAKDGTAIASWKPQGLMHSGEKQEIEYDGMKITWSGFNGVDGEKGHEYIKLSGVTTQMLILKVFGYESGEANVKYKWGKDIDDFKLVASKVDATLITSDSATIVWDLNAKATGVVTYGIYENGTITNSKKSKKEESFNYSHHGQLLTNLEANKLYGYYVESEDINGHIAKSKIYTFKTKEELKATLSATKVCIAAPCNVYGDNEDLAFVITNQKDDNENWIAIFKKSDSSDFNNVVQWQWTMGRNNIIFNPIEAGVYEVRLFYNNSYKLEAKYEFVVKGIPLEPVAYQPEPLPTDLLKDEAMNMDPNHPKFDNWDDYAQSHMENGEIVLKAQYHSAGYSFSNQNWLAHHKYTISFDMETVSNENLDVMPIVRVSFLKSFEQGVQNSVLNKKEKIYLVLASEDDIAGWKGIGISRRDNIANSSIKISNLKIYDGVIELPKPTLKDVAFDGAISMDKYGVFRQNNKTIFPITLYKDNNLITTKKRTIEQYLSHGITGNIMEADSEHWEDAKDESISKMVEGGATAMQVPITNYIIYKTYGVGSDYFNYYKFVMNNFKTEKKDVWDKISLFSIDNEFYHTNNQFKDSIQEIKTLFPNKPIQMLNGRESISSMYNNYIDLTGTYITVDTEVAANHLESRTNIHKFEAQRLTPSLHVPVTLLQVNQGSGENFSSIIIAGVAAGGTKVDYWKDSDVLFNGFRKLNITKLPMWDQLPTLRSYLDKMCDLGIIESSPYTGFKVEQTNDRYEYIKARLGKDGKAYILVSNMTSINDPKDSKFNQSYKNLHYEPTGKLIDIKTGQQRGSIDPVSKKIKIDLKPHEWMILEVERETNLPV